METAADEKKRLRTEVRRRIDETSAEERAAWNDALARRCRELPEIAAARSVLVCLSFGLEPDTWRMVDELVARDVRVWVPRVVRGEPHFDLHAYPCDLETLSIGLRQPDGRSERLPAARIDHALDAALVLGVAFGRRGRFRLGHGGGYFDRFFARHDVFGVGLGYDPQLLEAVPVEGHDVPMDVVVTPSAVVR